VPCTLDEAEDGVCACDSGCGCAAPAPPRGNGVGKPMRPASKVDLRNGVWTGGVCIDWLKVLSIDTRLRVLEAAGPGMANSLS
jgi:hypothetical protein